MSGAPKPPPPAELGRVHHLVFFKFKEKADSEPVKKVLEEFAKLPKKISGLLNYQAGPNIDTQARSKDLTHGFLLTFINDRARDDYINHPAHRQFVDLIKPILDEIQKKYAQNPQKLNQERLRVMREHKIGFPAGCLTILLQIPIWWALFQGLRVEFSLRHQAFLWADDLAMPDRLFHLPFWPHWFNLLPILMLVLWVWQQKATPTPASDDPQVRAQMKMMRFMPYLFFVFLYNYASALAVYMCVSSLWGIVEGKLVRRAIARLS